MLLRFDCIVLAYWNYSNVTKIRILDHSKIASNFFPLIRFFSFFYKQQDTWHSWSTSKKKFKKKEKFQTRKVSKKFKSYSGGKEKTNCLCRERQARNSKVCGNLWSYIGYQKIPIKFPKLNQKYRVSMGQKVTKNSYWSRRRRREKQVCNNNWKS